jgi:uncharacterized protein YgiM (DUF1202 family)
MANQEAPKVPKRGEAAWKAMKDGVAERNDAARKAAKQERKGHLANAEELRRAVAAKRQLNVRPGPGDG